MSVAATLLKAESVADAHCIPPQQIYIIQTSDGAIPVESAEVVVADDLAVYETVTALEQLSRGQVITTDNGELLQVYEEVVLPGGDIGVGAAADAFVDVAEVEVGNGRSASPVKATLRMLGINLEEHIRTHARSKIHEVKSASLEKSTSSSPSALVAAAQASIAASAAAAAAAAGEFHICRICSQFVPLGEIGTHNLERHGSIHELTCPDCGKVFKSKRSLFGHRKEKHSGVTEVHTCPECLKTFGRKSNLKAHRESLHYGKKFPCPQCDRIFTNRSSMNQHIKKTHVTLVQS